jgi:DNA-binding transcriptional ArsR family regulator
MHLKGLELQDGVRIEDMETLDVVSIPVDLICQRDIPDTAFRLLCLIRHIEQQKGQCWKSVRELATLFGRSQRTIQRGLASLRRAGLVDRQIGMETKYEPTNDRAWRSSNALTTTNCR